MTNATREFQITMSPSRARLLSLVVVGSLVVGYLADAIFAPEAPALVLGFAALKLVGLFGAILLFLSNFGQMSQRPESSLDEREVEIRNRAYVRTHHVMVACLFAAFFWMETANKLGWWLPSVSDAANLLTAFGISSMALPAAILAWTAEEIEDE
ncbi:MAG: hypothetical protein ACK4TG_08895 [Thermaurantiacus sp.]